MAFLLFTIFADICRRTPLAVVFSPAHVTPSNYNSILCTVFGSRSNALRWSRSLKLGAIVCQTRTRSSILPEAPPGSAA